MRTDRVWRALAVSALSAVPVLASAQTQSPGLPLIVAQGAAGTSYSVPIQTLLAFTALSFLPAVLLLMTGFTRIVIVLSLLRQALGTQAAPPNQVIIGLSLFLTFFVMAPTFDKVYTQAYAPYAAGTLAAAATIDINEKVATITVQTTGAGKLAPGLHNLQLTSVGKCEPNSVAPTGGAPGDFNSAGAHFQVAGHTAHPASGDLASLQVRGDGSAMLVTTTWRLVIAGFIVAALLLVSFVLRR